MVTETEEEGGKSKQPKFYTLYPASSNGEKAPALDPLAKAVLMSGDGDDLDLSDFYKHCLHAMMAGSSLDISKRVCSSSSTLQNLYLCV